MKEGILMKKFIPREKLGKRARKELDRKQRTEWNFSPVTRRVESKKVYNRRQKPYDRYDEHGIGFCFPFHSYLCTARI